MRRLVDLGQAETIDYSINAEHNHNDDESSATTVKREFSLEDSIVIEGHISLVSAEARAERAQ